MTSDTRRGITLVAGGAVAMSFAPVLVRLADVAPTTSAFYRLAIGGVALAVLARQSMRFDLGAGLWAVIAAAGALFAADLAFWHRSIHYIGPGTATILGNFQVFFVALFGWAVLRERIGPRYVTGTLIAFVGLVLLLGEGWGSPGETYRWGVVFGLLTAVAYAAYLITLRHTQSVPGRLGAVPNMAAISLIGMVGLSGAVAAEGESFAIPSVIDGAWLIGYGLVGQCFAWVSVSKGLALIPDSRASLILLLQPSLAFVWDVLLFGRPTDAGQAAGAALAIVGIYFGMRRG